jgi:hypothetical protein
LSQNVEHSVSFGRGLSQFTTGHACKAVRGKFTQGRADFELKGGNLIHAAASSSRATSGFILRRLVNAVADVERLDPCRGARRQTSTRRATGEATMYKASICSQWQASRGILGHLCPSAWKHAVVGWRSKSMEAGSCQKGAMCGPIDKLSMEEATSGAALLG